ncbi:aspartyl-phosphate phosphatase Spo0E family protein [Thalassobacillus sp. C254]|uniref:aspartyl-phosphate phosphatase Spo0E family protein n=1 Tax=Thalassobacillus sp. C254 TaxID=1225341 RepID=UPI0009FB35E8|nr:aspartyl-phosphate phosphatase Spo0E family protein [Thalassobacillus sp. C254]
MNVFMECMIKIKKKEMYKHAKRYGFTDERTVQCSQELDVLLNKYQGVKEKSEDMSLI